MKRLLSFIVFALLLSMTACGGQKEVQTEDDRKSTLDAGTSKIEESTAAPQPGAEEAVSFYGQWSVTDTVFTSPVYALSEEEIKQRQGTVITYSESGYTWNGNSCDTPIYIEEIETKEDFEQNMRLAFADAGISGEEAAVVSVENGDFFGSTFYIKDKDTLLILQDGVFFEAARGEKALHTDAVNGEVQVYEGTYFDSNTFGDSDRPGFPERYCAIKISNVTSSSFDFAIYEVDWKTQESEIILPAQTAVFVGDGMEAAYNGESYQLTFTFPDYHKAYPVVTDMEIFGFEPLEGKTYVNSSIPGHEFG